MRDRTTKPLLSALCADPLWTAQSSSWRHRMCQRAGGRFISEVRDLELTDGECTCPCHKNKTAASKEKDLTINSQSILWQP